MGLCAFCLCAGQTFQIIFLKTLLTIFHLLCFYSVMFFFIVCPSGQFGQRQELCFVVASWCRSRVLLPPTLSCGRSGALVGFVPGVQEAQYQLLSLVPKRFHVYRMRGRGSGGEAQHSLCQTPSFTLKSCRPAVPGVQLSAEEGMEGAAVSLCQWLAGPRSQPWLWGHPPCPVPLAGEGLVFV